MCNKRLMSIDLKKKKAPNTSVCIIWSVGILLLLISILTITKISTVLSVVVRIWGMKKKVFSYKLYFSMLVQGGGISFSL